jgi:DNA-binding SARP family transcriptional activator
MMRTCRKVVIGRETPGGAHDATSNSNIGAMTSSGPGLTRNAGDADRSPRRLSLLGGWQLVCSGMTLHLPVSGQRLLAYLCLHGRSSRSRLAGTLWPEASERHAYGSLRSALWRVQKSSAGVLVSSGDQLALDASVGVDVRDLLQEIRRLLDGVTPPSGSGFPRHLLDGELLPGWYDDWVLFERERLRQLRLHALETLALTLAGDGRFAAAVEAGLAAVRTEPLRESAHRAVVRVHLAEGNVTEALRQYELCRRLFRAELDLEPSALLTDLLPTARRAVTQP